MKILACLIFIGCSTFLGIIKSHGIYGRIQKIRGYENLLHCISSEILFHKAPLEETLIQIKPHIDQELIPWIDTLLQSINDPSWNQFSEAWIKSWDIYHDITKNFEEESLMKSLGSQLGQGDLKQHRELLSRTLTSLQQIEEEVRSEYRIRGRMYCSVGACVGIFLSVLML